MREVEVKGSQHHSSSWLSWMANCHRPLVWYSLPYLVERHSHPQQTTLNAEKKTKKQQLYNSTLIWHAFRSGRANVFHLTVENISRGNLQSPWWKCNYTQNVFPLHQYFMGKAWHRAKVMSSHTHKMCSESVKCKNANVKNCRF